MGVFGFLVFLGVPSHNALVSRDKALVEINAAVARAGTNARKIAQDAEIDYGTVLDFLSGARRTRNETVVQIERVIPNWPEGRFAALLVDLEHPSETGPSQPTLPPTAVELPAVVLDGLDEREVDELKADLVARSYTKSAEIKARPGRRHLSLVDETHEHRELPADVLHRAAAHEGESGTHKGEL